MRTVTHGKRRRSPEGDLQRALVKYLRDVVGAKVAITDPGMLRRHGVRNRSTGIPDGWADLTVPMPGGRTWYIECKSPKGRLTEDQRDFREWCEWNGHPYILARSMDDVIDAIKEIDNG